jgi:hypothetical protein
LVDLPRELLDVRDQHPWPSVAAGARQRLKRRAPELSDYVDEMPETVFGLGSGFFYLPAAQGRAWGLGNDWLPEFLILLALGHAHFAAQDLQIDSGRCPPALTLLSDVALLEYLSALRDRTPTSSFTQYTDLHDLYYRWYVRALDVELRHRTRLHPYRSEEVLLLGLKAAPGNTALHIVADASNHAQAAGELVLGVMQLCAGLQVIDDLNDLARDFEDRNFTMPLTATLRAMRAELGSLDQIDPEDLSLAAVSSRVADACLEVAQHCFELSGSSAARAEAFVLRDLADVWHRRAAERRQEIVAALGAASLA